ncbi:MAG: SRPBCC family protein [Actinomycetota bacterium]
MRPGTDAIASHAVDIEIDAPPEQLYDMVSDITRMGEWSPESVGGRWLDGGTGRVGDWFVGANETPERSWERECEVAAAEQGRDFTFVVLGVEQNCTWWSYEFEPGAGGGTTVTERWWIVNKTPAMAAATPEQFAARAAHTETMMRDTLAALKRAAEA